MKHTSNKAEKRKWDSCLSMVAAIFRDKKGQKIEHNKNPAPILYELVLKAKRKDSRGALRISNRERLCLNEPTNTVV